MFNIIWPFLRGNSTIHEKNRNKKQTPKTRNRILWKHKITEKNNGVKTQLSIQQTWKQSAHTTFKEVLCLGISKLWINTIFYSEVLVGKKIILGQPSRCLTRLWRKIGLEKLESLSVVRLFMMRLITRDIIFWKFLKIK